MREGVWLNFNHAHFKQADPDQLVSLVGEVSPSSCLIFCSTKKNCENVALMIAKGLSK